MQWANGRRNVGERARLPFARNDRTFQGTPTARRRLPLMCARQEVLCDVEGTLRRLQGELDALTAFNAGNDVVTARDPVREKELRELMRLHRRLELMRASPSAQALGT